MPHFPPVVFAIAFAALVVALSALARRLPIPTPVLQLLAGLAIGLTTAMKVPDLDPDLVFFVFLPPILWSAAMFTSPREFRRNIGPISLLAIGLVLVTAAVVAIGSSRRPQLIGSLAEHVARIGRLPLIGTVATRPVDGRANSAHRVRALLDAVSVAPDLAAAVAEIDGPVLLIDDYIDSGWTMAIAARALRQAGAGSVLPLALGQGG